MESSVLKEFVILCTLTVGITQVYKEVVSDQCTQKISVCIAILLSLVTGTGILTSLGFVPSSSFTDQLSFLKPCFAVLFYLTDLFITGFLASKGSNYLVDLLKGNLLTQKQ